jgi:hypothetical protein
MSDDALIAAADLETVRQLRAALDVAMQENEQRTQIERALRADAAALRAALLEAQVDVCSLNCPSVWKTADGPPPHSDKCQAINTALASQSGAHLLAELEAARAVVVALNHIEVNYPPLTDAVRVYDAAVKVRSS